MCTQNNKSACQGFFFEIRHVLMKFSVTFAAYCIEIIMVLGAECSCCFNSKHIYFYEICKKTTNKITCGVV